jgi:hypothetical protein
MGTMTKSPMQHQSRGAQQDGAVINLWHSNCQLKLRAPDSNLRMLALDRIQEIKFEVIEHLHFCTE